MKRLVILSAMLLGVLSLVSCQQAENAISEAVSESLKQILPRLAKTDSVDVVCWPPEDSQTLKYDLELTRFVADAVAQELRSKGFEALMDESNSAEPIPNVNVYYDPDERPSDKTSPTVLHLCLTKNGYRI